MKRCTAFILAIMFLVIVLPAAAPGSESPGAVAPAEGENKPQPLQFEDSNGKVVVIIAGRTSIDDWNYFNMPVLKSLAGDYSTGLVNCKTGGNKSFASTCLTMGAGVPLRAPYTDEYALKTGEQVKSEPAEEIYYQKTGREAPEDSIIRLDIARIHKYNIDSPYGPGPGTLGKELRENGVKTAVLGNSDSIKGRNRQAVTFAMDDMGIVDGGYVNSSILEEDSDFPGGKRTDYSQILQQFEDVSADHRFIVVDAGDFYRIDDAESEIFDSLVPELREQSARRFDNFLGNLLNQLNLEKDLLLVVSPVPEGRTVRGDNLLTPVLAAGNGIDDGILFSTSTKRPGIIRNTDILPVILDFFNIDSPEGITGNSFQVLPGSYSMSSLENMHDELVLTNDLRSPVLKNYILLQLILLGASLLFIFWKKRVPMAIIRPVLLAVMSVPAAFLILPLLQGTSVFSVFFWMFILVGLITVLAMSTKRFGKFTPFMFISCTTSLLIIVDLLLGAPLQKCSLMSYSPIVGARFYGLGNEYMGVLVSGTIIGAASILSIYTKYRRLLLTLISLYFIFVIYVIASPSLGTNFGGTISALGAFLVTGFLCWEFRISFKTIGFIIFTMGIVLAGFVGYDLTRPPSVQSHIGRAASLVLSGGIPELINIVSRKLAINIKLVRYTIWSRIFLGSLVCLAILFFRPVGTMEMIRRKYPYLYKGFSGVLAGAFLAFMFNDSGVVAAATSMIFGAYPLIYLILLETSPSGK